ARERSASSSRAHGPAPGSRATPRRALRPAGVAGPAQPSAGHSIVRGARLRSVDWMVPTASRASSVSFPCPASLVTVILANSVSQETGSDLSEPKASAPPEVLYESALLPVSWKRTVAGHLQLRRVIGDRLSPVGALVEVILHEGLSTQASELEGRERPGARGPIQA